MPWTPQDTERRRIERDLHDGTQQRLTSLAMNLGIARTSLAGLPEPAQQAIVGAHEEAKLALAELRDLVRGMHPAVLDDRGLDAALSGLAARSPVPVRLHINLPERVARELEAVAYFMVSEALTNATSHAGASRIEVTVERVPDRLRVTVAGTLGIDSSTGGPTILTAELPCGS